MAARGKHDNVLEMVQSRALHRTKNTNVCRPTRPIQRRSNSPPSPFFSLLTSRVIAWVARHSHPTKDHSMLVHTLPIVRRHVEEQFALVEAVSWIDYAKEEAAVLDPTLNAHPTTFA